MAAVVLRHLRRYTTLVHVSDQEQSNDASHKCIEGRVKASKGFAREETWACRLRRAGLTMMVQDDAAVSMGEIGLNE